VRKEEAEGPPRAGIRETDLYGPVRGYLEQQGYTVRGEVQRCDLAATRGDELILIELKRALTLELLVQATQRQRVTDSVYIAVPRPSGAWMRAHWRGVRHLLRRLELGVLFVALESSPPEVQVVFHPVPFQRQRNARGRRAVLREIAGRSEDWNEGGSTRRKLVTAYRENALLIACCLERFGPCRPADLRALGTGPKTLAILCSNFYHWFERIERGVYALSPLGRATLAEYPELVTRFRRQLTAGE
jgi:hypothetical protein